MFILQNHYTLFGIFCKELYDDKCRIIYKQLGLYVMQGRAMLAPTNYNIQKRDDLSVIAENVNPGNITESSLKNIIILRAPKTFSFRQRYDPPFIKAKISIKLLNRRICGVAAATYSYSQTLAHESRRSLSSGLPFTDCEAATIGIQRSTYWRAVSVFSQ